MIEIQTLTNSATSPGTGFSVIQLLPTGLGFLGGFLTAVLAEPLRQRFFAPVLGLSFGRSEDYISHTPELLNGQPSEATYLRLKVRNKSFRLAKSCRAFLTNVQRIDRAGHARNTEYCDSIQLAWSVRPDEQYGAQDLAQGVPYFVDIASFRDGTDVFMPHVKSLPLRYHPIFAAQGQYLLTIVVSGDGVKPGTVKVRIDWRGDRKAIGAQTAA